MGSHVVEEPLQLRFKFNRLVPSDQQANSRTRLGVNALMGMGLWVLLWLGYNISCEFWLEPSFPATSEDLIHGTRAFFPFAAAWIGGSYFLKACQTSVSGPDLSSS